MPGFQHYVSGVPEPLCRSQIPLLADTTSQHTRCAVAWVFHTRNDPRFETCGDYYVWSDEGRVEMGKIIFWILLLMVHSGGQIFRIGTVIAHCTDSEDFPSGVFLSNCFDKRPSSKYVERLFVHNTNPRNRTHCCSTSLFISRTRLNMKHITSTLLNL